MAYGVAREGLAQIRGATKMQISIFLTPSVGYNPEEENQLLEKLRCQAA
jgi:hypothetical protein